MLKAKMSQTFHGTWEAKEEIFFSQAFCISQDPFHAPIRGGYQGEGRLSKMDCSDTTQSLQVVLHPEACKDAGAVAVNDSSTIASKSGSDMHRRCFHWACAESVGIGA